MVVVDACRKHVERGIFRARCIEAHEERLSHVFLEILPWVFGAPDNMILVLVAAVIQGANPHETSVAHRSGVLRAVRFIPVLGTGFPRNEKRTSEDVLFKQGAGWWITYLSKILCTFSYQDSAL